MTKLRPELTPLPLRMQRLPIDKRGYPIPAFVEYRHGEPDFRFMSAAHWKRCVRQRVCWVCGDPLGVYLTFVIGPMCIVNRTSSEPPSHRDCAIWSALNCPFLARPHMTRREDEVSAESHPAGGVMITRNPGVACVWNTRDYQIVNDGAGHPVIRVGDPQEVLWFSEGRAATRDEVLASIASGLPLLEEVARGDSEAAVIKLQQAARQAMRLIPEEARA